MAGTNDAGTGTGDKQVAANGVPSSGGIHSLESIFWTNSPGAQIPHKFPAFASELPPKLSPNPLKISPILGAAKARGDKFGSKNGAEEWATPWEQRKLHRVRKGKFGTEFDGPGKRCSDFLTQTNYFSSSAKIYSTWVYAFSAYRNPMPPPPTFGISLPFLNFSTVPTRWIRAKLRPRSVWSGARFREKSQKIPWKPTKICRP